MRVMFVVRAATAGELTAEARRIAAKFGVPSTVHLSVSAEPAAEAADGTIPLWEGTVEASWPT